MQESIILASASPRRAKILSDLGRSFTVVKSDAREVCHGDDPERTVRENALAKGEAVRSTGAVRGLSADTIVWFNGRIYGKPADIEEAKSFLRELSGNVHSVYTAVAFDGDVRVVKSDVKFRALSEETIERYVSEVNPLDRAGAYDIDESGDLIVESWTGSYENIMGLPLEPLREWGLGYYERAFSVRSYESGVENRLSLPSLCNYLQEIAGNHADKLNLGIGKLQKGGVSWMLSRLRVSIGRDVGWGDELVIRTWPSGTKGKLAATRDFKGIFGGEEVFEAVSEWLVVDLAAQRIVRLPENFRSLAPEGTPRVAMAAEDGGGKFAALSKVDEVSRILVRRSDHDFNDHVNNVHYVEWALEAVPGDFSAKRVETIDIVFRQAAHAGDELESRVEIVDGRTLRHVIVRKADETLLVTAETKWS